MADKTVLTIEVTRDERQRIEELAKARGFDNADEYLLALVKRALGLFDSTTAQEELREIIATYPPEQVIDRIEELNPDWKHDLLPWQVAKPGEKIPWQAVYIIKRQPATPTAIAWAEKRLAELKAAGDVP